jgi:signal transduction histidine kinase/CheY-like chemotaxis protein
MSTHAIDALVQAAWGQHFRDPATLVDRGREIVALADDGSTQAAWGWLQQAWGERFAGQAGASDHALAMAQQFFEHAGHAGGLAACRDMRAVGLGVARQIDAALGLLDENLRVPTRHRSAYERMPTHHRRAWLLDLQGRRDNSLRDRYAMLVVARETGDAAAVAYAMGLLGGAHADQYNLEEADRLCSEATTLAQSAGAFHAFVLAALNHLNALVTLGHGEQALPLVHTLQAREDELSPRVREQRFIVYADVHLLNGNTATAQELLDKSVQLRHPGSQSLLSWTTAQVACHVAQGQFEQARTLGQAWLAQPDHGTDPGQVPSEQLRLLRNLSLACEQVGDVTGALRHQRQAFDVHEALVGRSARARRLVLEIEHQLDRERWQREQAQQRQQAAEAEGQRLDQANRALQAANQAKTRFLAAASHDLRQPVQALAMTMAALQCESLSPAQGQLVQRMGQSLSALGRMFDVLLDISRLDAGIVPVRVQTLDLRPLLHRLVDEHRAAAQAQGLQLRLRLPQDGALPLHTHTDPVLLERCLRNFLDNAMKYTPKGGVLVAVQPDAAASGWRLSVVDTGLGMAPQVLAHVFDEFFQADNPERDRSRGLGLGLSIVQRVARLLEHPVDLRSRPGQGTCIGLRLPRAAQAAAPVGASLHGNFSDSAFSAVHHMAAAGGPGAADGAGSKAGLGADLTASPAAAARHAVSRCVAVIDDDAAVRDSLVAVVERWGHTVLAGADPAAVVAAWRAAGQPRVQALLADLRLRGQLTGVQAVQRLRQQWGAGLPALVITGDMAPDRLQLLRDSGLPWLPKPVMPMRLRSWLAGL